MAYESFEDSRGTDLDTRTGASDIAINEYGGGGIAETPRVRIETASALSSAEKPRLYEWAFSRGLRLADFDQRAFEFIYNPAKRWRTFDVGGDWVQAVTGSASASNRPGALQANTNATAGSTASVRTGNALGLCNGVARNKIDWSKPLFMSISFATAGTTTAGHSRVTLGKSGSDGIGALVGHGVGIEIEDDSLLGIVHDGTSQTRGAFATLTDEAVYRVDIISDGAGNVDFHLNGNPSAGSSTTDGPSVLSASGDSVLQVESMNDTDAAAQNITVFDIKILTYDN
jgi:hypothetical protein